MHEPQKSTFCVHCVSGPFLWNVSSYQERTECTTLQHTTPANCNHVTCKQSNQALFYAQLASRTLFLKRGKTPETPINLFACYQAQLPSTVLRAKVWPMRAQTPLDMGLTAMPGCLS